MAGRDHLYLRHFEYGHHHPDAVPPVVQPPPPPPPHHHHRTLSFHQQQQQQQEEPQLHDPARYPHIPSTPLDLHPYPPNHMPLPPHVPTGTEHHDIVQENIQLEQQAPIKRTRRRRGQAAAERNAALAANSASVNRPVRINPHSGVVIKTKFPVARIKRIMQADEDVGKVAQVTPVIVSKALELFMIALCAKATEQAQARNSKRITARDLKQVVIADEQFDFLEDIMAKVPDIPFSSENNQGNVSDEEVNTSGGPGPAKKPRKPRTRKLKEEDSC